MSNFQHDDDTCPHLVRASLLEAENARLKTEVQHLMIFCNSTLIPSKELQAENARLKAEVERLTKAGDAVILLMYCYKLRLGDISKEKHTMGVINAWNAAKESKPSV